MRSGFSWPFGIKWNPLVNSPFVEGSQVPSTPPPPPIADYIISETGDFLLSETGAFLIVE